MRVCLGKSSTHCVPGASRSTWALRSLGSETGPSARRENMALDCQERAVAVGWRKIRRELRTARGAGPGFLGSSVLRLCTPPPGSAAGQGKEESGVGRGCSPWAWRSPEVGVHPPLSLPDQVSLEPSFSEGRWKGPEACGRSVCPKKRDRQQQDDGGSGPSPSLCRCLGWCVRVSDCSRTSYGGTRGRASSCTARQGLREVCTKPQTALKEQEGRPGLYRGGDRLCPQPAPVSSRPVQ